MTGLFLILDSPVQAVYGQSGGIVIHRDAKVDRLVEFYSEQENAKEEERGYRVQILAGTSREKALKVQNDFNSLFPQYRAYLTYSSPYFKIRVGDFTERLDAHRFMHRIDRKFPGAFIVEETVNLK
jgi:hypothetical protein